MNPPKTRGSENAATEKRKGKAVNSGEPQRAMWLDRQASVSGGGVPCTGCPGKEDPGSALGGNPLVLSDRHGESQALLWESQGWQ